MNRIHVIGRRAMVRTISFIVALIVALTAAAIGGYNASRRYRTTIEYAYQRALAELTETIGNIDITLEKGQYAATAKQMQGLSSKLWREAGYAKGALSRLPIDGTPLETTYKFLSQVGSFCMALSDKVSAGGELTEEERAALDQLANYASSLSDSLTQMSSDLENGALTFGKTRAVLLSDSQTAALPDISSGFREMEEGFTDYPTLIYDGPFSDHIQQQSPRYLEGMPAVSVDQALAAAVKATGVQNLEYDGNTDGRLPCYNFVGESITASVTQAGGVPDYFLNARALGEPTLTVEQAVDRAKRALSDRGLSGFVMRYYSMDNGVVTVNFAATQDGVVCYPDLIKIGVAMDLGDVVSYDAKGYIENHTERTLPAPEVSEEQARAALSPRLTPESHAMAVVPSEGLSEVYCHEFLCRGQDDEQVLVYIDAQTGMEEQILILLQSDTGVLAM